MDSTTERIFLLLKGKGIEQKEFAALIGTTDKTVSAWKNGRSKSYTKYLPQIAGVLGTTAEYLLTGKKEPAADSDLHPDFFVKFNSLSKDDQEDILAIMEVKLARRSPKKQ